MSENWFGVELKSSLEYQVEGMDMLLSDFLSIKRPEFTNNIRKRCFEIEVTEKYYGYVKNESVPVEDKIKALLHIAPLIGVICPNEEDAKRQVLHILRKSNR